MAQQLLGVSVTEELLERPQYNDPRADIDKYHVRFAPASRERERLHPQGTLRLPYFLDAKPILDAIERQHDEGTEGKHFHEAARMLTIVRMLKESVDAETPENEAVTMRPWDHEPLKGDPERPTGVLLIDKLWTTYADRQHEETRTLAQLRKATGPRYVSQVTGESDAPSVGVPPFHFTKEAARLMDVLDYVHALVRTVAAMYTPDKDTSGTTPSEIKLFEGMLSSHYLDTFEPDVNAPSRNEGEGPVRWMYYYAMRRVGDELEAQRADLEGLHSDLQTCLRLSPFEARLAIRPDILDGGLDERGGYALTKHEMYVEGTPIPTSEIMVEGEYDDERFIAYAHGAGVERGPEGAMLVAGLFDKIENIALYTVWRGELTSQVHLDVALQNSAAYVNIRSAVDDEPVSVDELALFEVLEERNARAHREDPIEGYSTVIRTATSEISYLQESNPLAPKEPLPGTPIATLRAEGTLHVVDRTDRDVPVLSDEKMASLVEVKLDDSVDGGKLAMLVLISVHMVDLVRAGRPDMASDANGNRVNWLAAIEADPVARKWRRSVHITKKAAGKLGIELQQLRTTGVDSQTLGVSDGVRVVQHNFCSMASALEQLTRSRLIVCENKALLFSAIDAYTRDLVPKAGRDTPPYSLGSWSWRLANPQGDQARSESNAVPVVVDLRDMVFGYHAPDGGLFSPHLFAPRGADQSSTYDGVVALSHHHIELSPLNAEALGTDGSVVETNGRASKYKRSSYGIDEVFGASAEFASHWKQMGAENLKLLKCKYLACTDLTQFVRTLHVASWGAPLYLVADQPVPRQNFLLSDAFDELRARPAHKRLDLEAVVGLHVMANRWQARAARAAAEDSDGV